MSVQKQNRLLAGIVLIISFIVYFDTMAPTVSYWDCGEFIATSYTLGVPHPPGSPLYLIIGRIFSMIPFSSDIAFRVNLISPIVSALAVMLLYLIIVQFITQWRGPIKTIEDRLVAFGSGLVGSLAFAFSDSHWFNAVEAEVYAMSTFFTAIVVWLILRWAERSDQVGNERYILIISYMVGLATGIHLLNLLALPFIGLIIYFRKREFTWPSFFVLMGIVGAIFLIIYLGIIKGLPKLASVIGLSGVLILIFVILGAIIYSINRKHQLWTITLASFFLIILGYSTYTMLFIRSNQNPSIDQNDPETVERFIKYLEREQYGNFGFLPRRFNKLPAKHEVVGPPKNGREYTSDQNVEYMFYDFGRQLKFLWNYQIVKMYIRYFLWQFIGRGQAGDKWVTSLGANQNRSEDGVNWVQFGFPFAFLLGILGMVYQFKRDEKHAFSVLTLFFITGLAIIFYVNQDNPQPRERDYSYVGSFLAFSIWIGIGAAAILERILEYFRDREIKINAVYGSIALQLILIPAVMLRVNYNSHDRSGNFVAWDYSYNILETCEPNAIIFTNGDNDTFPLWYLQEVEGIRKDVTVANLSLLNTDWYIRQLRDSRPPGERFINLTDDQISGKSPIGRNPATGEPLYLQVSRWEKTPISIPVHDDSLNTEGKISWVVKPTFGRQAIRVQDLMIMHIINESKWRYPIYFAVTVAYNNKIGLDKYLEMEGLAFRLESHKTRFIDYERLKENLIGKYRFRNLDNPDVYYNPNIVKLLQNYRSAFLQLSNHDLIEYKRKERDPLVKDDELIGLRQNALAYIDSMNARVPYDVIPMTSMEMSFRLGQLYYELGELERSREIYEALYATNPNQPEFVGMLLRIYEDLEQWDEGISILEKWLQRSANDTIAKRFLKNFKEKKRQAEES